MAQITDAQLMALAVVVRDEVLRHANTATRVGTLFENMVDSKQNKSMTVHTHNIAATEITDEYNGVIVHVTRTVNGASTITVESAAIAIRGFHVTIKDAGLNAGTNNITVVTEGAETIEGEVSLLINGDGNSISLYSDGSNLFIY